MTVVPYKEKEGSKKAQVAEMFNNISRRYDFLNHFLSLGIDIVWRKKAVRELKEIKPKQILDIATGTGDFAIEALSLKPDKVIGVDISEGMLAMGKKKIARMELEDKVELQMGDSEKLLFDDNTFDAVIVAFKYIWPSIGRMSSKDRAAYTYLPESVKAFPDGVLFTNILDRVGFKKTICKPQTFGICSIYTGIK